MTKKDPIIELVSISKRFGGVTALNDVSMDVHTGEVLAIVGDNGAGKSTLIKILTGLYQPSSGTMRMAGEELIFNDHSEAISKGIGAVYQTLAIAGDLDTPANLFLGQELRKKFLGISLLDNKRMRSEAQRVLSERFGIEIPNLSAPTDRLSGGQRQAVAIARAIYHSNLKILIMDEPTAALGPQETGRTLELIRTLQQQGLTIILVSHSLDNVFAVANRIHVMRRGKHVGALNVNETSPKEVLGLIVGAEKVSAS